MSNKYASLLLASFGLFTACSDKEEATPMSTMTELTATVNGAQQVPANASTANGTFAGIYTSSNKQLVYTVTYQGMTPTIAHIHTGAPGTSGSVAIPFQNLTSPITGTVTLTAEQADNLLSNRMYVNLHSAAFPSGEIRGDIKKK
ncbi:CHRD domain-containing protein [Hymenobacter sp. BT683]|uniref:CHRD domain-containing protein n=1 Tax=Hymenobacter jeongseonensis TaxID=2791027 RepID=A0ABS0IIA8_9BACT|nr:CHRD domain-containing protein [Hymenobacter jeongseonensis]MBF9238097.1 CHRD domain-containing protein [Hymenobacter jeongseonensis]